MDLVLHRPDETSIDADVKGFFEKIHRLDVSAYDPEDAGEVQPMVDRYMANRETYAYVTDEDAEGAVVGYINFFPCSDDLRNRINDPGTIYTDLDDGITPADIVPYTKGQEHFIFILSVVVDERYRGGKSNTLKLLAGAFAAFLRQLVIKRKCLISGIGACAVSAGGVSVLEKMGFHKKHELAGADTEHPRTIYICDDSDSDRVYRAGALSVLIYEKGREGSRGAETFGPGRSCTYVKTWEDDVYLYLPMTEHAANTGTDVFFEDSIKDNSGASGDDSDTYIPPLDPDSLPVDREDEIPSLIVKALENSIGYECSSVAVRDMKVHFLGCYDFLHTTDEYPCIDRRYDPVHDGYLEEGDFDPDASHPDDRILDRIFTYSDSDTEDRREEVTGLQKGYVFITSHRPTHMYVVNVFFPDYQYSTTQLEDQVSNNYIKIVDPGIGYDTADAGCGLRFIRLYDYLWIRYLLHRCGQEKIMLCMSGKPAESVYATEFENVLSAEVYNSLYQNFHIRSETLSDACRQNQAQYDYYEVYLSNKVIAFIPNEYGDIINRVQITSTYSFIAELVMFQNTAIARMNTKVSDMLYHTDKVSMDEVTLLEREYGMTIPFWEPGNFNYLGTAYEAKCIKEAFSNDELLEMYSKNQEYLENMIELMTSERENKNSMLLNIVATVLAIIQVESFVTDILTDFYASTGIELSEEYAGFTKSFNHAMMGGLLLIIIYLVIHNRRRRRDMKKRR